MSTLYVVVRRTWFSHYDGFDRDAQGGEGGIPVAAFAARADAETLCERLEREARAEVRAPFLLGEELWRLTDRTEEDYCRYLEEVGLTPPPEQPMEPPFGEYRYRAWEKWTAELAANITPAQREALWQSLDRLRFYAVVAVELDDEEA